MLSRGDKRFKSYNTLNLLIEEGANVEAEEAMMNQI